MGYNVSSPRCGSSDRAAGGCLCADVLWDLLTTCVGTQETLLRASRAAATQTALQLLTAQCSHSPQ